ncbi:MAG TPA: ATP-binding protein, partial [Ruminiclostridium sp.]|nr:ATP-binding protein [Ruminiclostridium sp.]
VDGLMTDNYKSISAAQNMTEALEQLDNAAINYISFDSSKGISDFYLYENKFDGFYDIASHNITENGEKTAVDSIGSDYAKLRKLFSQMQLVYDKSGRSDAENFYNTSMQPVFNRTRKNLSNLILINQKAMFSSKSIAASNVKSTVYVLIIISIFAVIGGYFISRHLVNKFLHPLDMLTEGISSVRAGELGRKLEIKSDDEAGRLAHEFNEMTERLSAYEMSTVGTLMNERNKFVAIVRSLSDPIIVLDGNYRIILTNSACEKYFSIEEDNVRGCHFLEAIHDGSLFDLISQSVEKQNKPTENVIKLEKDGKASYFNVAVTPVKGMHDATSSYILLLRNVTELKELDCLRTDLFAAVSHELKTPLTSIIMGASLLSDKGLGNLNSDQNNIVKAISDDGERLSSFVSEILEISKIESEKSAYNFTPCSVFNFVQNSCDSFSVMASRHDVNLKNTVDPELPFVRADFKKISWVINNLLSNALKYTSPGDSITVGAAAQGDFVLISVTDTGVGIPKEFQDRIFDRFVHLENPEHEIRGNGIGLSVAKDVITAHGGTIKIKSEPGCGSSFLFTLPIIINKTYTNSK